MIVSPSSMIQDDDEVGLPRRIGLWISLSLAVFVGYFLLNWFATFQLQLIVIGIGGPLLILRVLWSARSDPMAHPPLKPGFEALGRLSDRISVIVFALLCPFLLFGVVDAPRIIKTHRRVDYGSDYSNIATLEDFSYTVWALTLVSFMILMLWQRRRAIVRFDWREQAPGFWLYVWPIPFCFSVWSILGQWQDALWLFLPQSYYLLFVMGFRDLLPIKAPWVLVIFPLQLLPFVLLIINQEGPKHRLEGLADCLLWVAVDGGLMALIQGCGIWLIRQWRTRPKCES